MPIQKQLFPEAPTSPDGAEQRVPGSQADHGSVQTIVVQPAPVWLQRLSLFVLVLFCLYVGGIVTVLPWLTSMWDHNLFFTSHPQLWAILRLGPTRGVISGLGLLDIWIGLSEAIHYHDQRS